MPGDRPAVAGGSDRVTQRSLYLPPTTWGLEVPRGSLGAKGKV